MNSHLLITIYKQTRVRSWSAGQGFDFSVPAVHDKTSGRYFAALDSPGSDPALVSWSDGDPIASLDTLVDGSTARLVGGCSVLVPCGAVSGGGCLSVDATGLVRWFGADARKLAASMSETTQSTIVECATREIENGGVLVVTSSLTKASKAKTGKSKTGDTNENVRVATLYRATGEDDEGRRVERAWHVECEPPRSDGDKETGPVRVIAAAAEGTDLTLLWSNGVWASYNPLGGNSGRPTRTLQFEDGENTNTKKAGGKRNAGARGNSESQQGSLASASCTSLGGGYFAVARSNSDGASVCVVDAKWGGVHASRNVPSGAGGVAVAALRDADADGAFRVALCLANEVSLVEVPSMPPVSLAVVIGTLSTSQTGAAARALGRANVSAAAAAKNVSVLVPRLETLFTDGKTGKDLQKQAFGSGSVVGISLDGRFETNDDAHARNAFATFQGEHVTAAAASSALDPFLSELKPKSKSKAKGKGNGNRVPMPPAVLTAALDACVRCSLWEPLRALVNAGFVTSSTTAPGMVRALLEQDRLEDVEAFFVSAKDVDAHDLKLCIDACLGNGKGKGVSVSDESLIASQKRLFVAAESAVVRAEKLALDASVGKDSRVAAAHEARVAACSVEQFPASSMPWASALHIICTRPIDPIAAAATLPSLTPDAAQKMATFLAAWLAAYASLSVNVSLDAPKGLPSLASVIGWTSALIDAHFTSFAVGAMGGFEEEGKETELSAGYLAMRRAADKLHAACDAVGKIGGALAHIAEGAAVPEHQGVLSTTYSIEVVDW